MSDFNDPWGGNSDVLPSDPWNQPFPTHPSHSDNSTDESTTDTRGNREAVARLATDIRNRLAPHWSTWTLLDEDEARHLVANEHRRFFTLNRRGQWEETRGRVVGSTAPWVCLERISTDPSRKVRSSGGAAARSRVEEAGRDTMTPEEEEAVRQAQQQREINRTDRTLHLEYLDDQGEPVPDIRYTVSLNGTEHTGRLNDNGQATLSNLPAGEASIVYEADQSRLPELRQELKTLLDNIIDERSDRKDMMNDLLAESSYIEQGLILTGAFMVSFWDSAKELVSDTADLVTGAADGLTAASAALYEKLADGYSLDELEDDFSYVVTEAGHAWDQAEKAYTVLKWLATDDETWSMLVDFPKRFFDSMSTVEKVEALGALAFDILFAIALAVATALTAGAAAAVAGSAAAIKYSRYFTETIGTLRSIYRMLPTGLIEKRYKRVRLQSREQDHTGRSDDPRENLNKPSEDTTNSNSKTGTDEPTQCEARSTCRNDPINMLTGEELFSHVDFELGGPLPLVWKRLYRSTASGRRGDLGYGWSHPFDQSIELKDGQLIHRDAEGAFITFPLPDDGKRLRNQWGTVISRYGDYISLRQDDAIHHFAPDPHQPDRWRLSHLSTTDRKHRWELRYNDTEPGQGRLTRATASWGAVLHLHSGTHGWHRITGRSGPQVPERTLAHYRIDRHGDLIAARNHSGQLEQYRYEHHLFRLRQTATGLRFGFEWDATTPDARCTRQYEEGGHYDYRFQWDPENRTSTATDGRGYAETFVFDREGNLIEQTRPDGTIERWEFDSHSRLRAHTDPLGNATRFDYDQRDRLVKRTDALGHAVRLHYWNDSPQPSQIIDPLGQRTHYDYNPDGQLTAVRHPDGSEERWTYHGDRLIGHQDRQGRQHRYHWHDTLGTLSRYECLTERDDEPGTLTTLADIAFEYDDQGRLHTQTDQHGRQQHFQYDDHGRLTTQLDEHNRAWRFDYDRAGRLVSQTDPSGRTTELRYGAFAQPEARVLPNGTEIRYEYDAERNLTAVINGNGRAHRFEYDGCERLIKEIGVDGRTTEYAYNDAGHLTDLHEGPIHATFERNALGQLIREQYQHAERAEANTWAEYTYDALGRLIKARNEHAEQNLTYDAAGRLHEDEIEQSFPGWMNQARPYRHLQQYHYTAHGQLQTVAHSATVARPPNQKWPTLHHDFRQPGWRQHYDWNPDGTLKRFGVNLPGDSGYSDGRPTSTPILEQRFNDLGLLTERREGAHTSHWDYDPEQRLQRYRRIAQQDPDRPVQERTYGYDDAGRINRIHDKRHGERRYQYDALDQLTRTDIRHPDQDKAESQIHNVDAAGNQLPDGLDHLLDNRLPFHGDRHFDYDDHGNLIRIRRGTGQILEQRLSYNAKHQLIRIEDYKDGELQQRLTFRYDALGRRIDKAVQGWVTPDTQKNEKSDEAEFKLRYREAYVWQGHTLIQVRHIGTDFMPKNNRVYFYEPGTHVPVALWDQKLGLHQIDTDHAGTPKAMYRHDTGEELWSTDHHSYGETSDSEAAMIHPVTGYSFEPGLRQQGQYEDIETGLYQNCYRFYDPGSGRYVSQDPIGLMGGLNVYQYCPNPVNYVDPLGLSTKECDKDEASRSGIPNISDIGNRISNKQLRHIKDRQEWINRGQGGYLNSMEDAQSVLTAAHNGEAEFLGSNAQGFPVIRYNDITGYNNNPGAGYSDQPTNVFIIKGTAKPSIVPTNPNWSPN